MNTRRVSSERYFLEQTRIILFVNQAITNQCCDSVQYCLIVLVNRLVGLHQHQSIATVVISYVDSISVAVMVRPICPYYKFRLSLSYDTFRPIQLKLYTCSSYQKYPSDTPSNFVAYCIELFYHYTT